MKKLELNKLKDMLNLAYRENNNELRLIVNGIGNLNQLSYVLFRAKGYFYLGTYSPELEFKTINDLKLYIDTIDYYPLKSVLNTHFEDFINGNKKAIPKLDLENRPNWANGFESLIRLTTNTKILRKLSNRRECQFYITDNNNCPSDILDMLFTGNPDDTNQGNIMSNYNTSVETINKFTPELMSNFHISYYKHLIENPKYSCDNSLNLLFIAMSKGISIDELGTTLQLKNPEIINHYISKLRLENENS